MFQSLEIRFMTAKKIEEELRFCIKYKRVQDF